MPFLYEIPEGKWALFSALQQKFALWTLARDEQ